jgi:signal transduction histidine kinase
MLLGQALLTLGFVSGQYGKACAIVLLAGLTAVLAPRLAAKAVPYGFFGLAIYGVVLANAPTGHQVAFYGAVPAPNTTTWAGSQNTYWTVVVPTWMNHLVLPQALVFLAAGLWLLLRQGGGPESLLRAGYAELRGSGPAPAWLLLPVYGLWAGLAEFRSYITYPVLALVVLVLLCMAVVTVLLWPRIAAIAAVFGLSAYSMYGIFVTVFWPALPATLFGLLNVSDYHRALLAGVLGLLLFGLVVMTRMWPRVIADSPERALAERASWLSQRVQRLTQTRSDATETAIAELKRIERDLHDGAQARLVALGMSLRAAEKLMLTSPEAALALVAEARETSSRALSDLRDLVRGIYPPVLADRGLADALRSLALDAPLPVAVTVDIPDDVAMPLAAAVYFAVAEALANAVRHSGAGWVQVVGWHTGSALRVEVTDDGCGGADPSRGTGLAGVERRLSAFDGILAVSSPFSGPTIVVIEVPCASSSVKISTS